MDKKFKGTYFISSISFATTMTENAIACIFTLFMLYVLHFSTPLAANSYSYYYGFAYSLPILIGYISDKYLTKTKSITLGFISLILSQLIMSFSASLYHPSNITYYHYLFNLQNITFGIGLFFLALGTSFSSVSVTSIINAINNNDLRARAFSIYYPINNMGVLIGTVLMTIIIGVKNYHLYKLSFLLLAIIPTIGLIAFQILKKKYLVDNQGKVMHEESDRNSIINEKNNLLRKISSKSISEIKHMHPKEKLHLFSNSIIHRKELLFVFIIFLIISILTRISFSQNSIGMVFFLNADVIRDLNFYEIPVQLLFILNPLYIIILSPLFIKFNNKLDEKNIKFSFINAIMVSMFFLILCFILMSALGYYLDVNNLPPDKINFIWILLFELLLAISELFFSIPSLAFIGKLAPKKYYSLFFGIFTATYAVSRYLSGKISTLFPERKNILFINSIPINGLMNYFLIFIVIISTAILILLISRKRFERIIDNENITD